MAFVFSQVLEKIAPLAHFHSGPKEREVENISTPKLAGNKSLLFISDLEHLELAQHSPARAAIIQSKLMPQAERSLSGWSLAKSDLVGLAMARIARDFFPLRKDLESFAGPRIHPTAFVSPTAKIAQDAVIGPFAAIGERVEIGAGAYIGAQCCLEADVKIGPRTKLHPMVKVGHSCELGSDCEVKSQTVIGGDGYGFAHDEQFQHERITHYGRVVVEDRVHIGGGVQIDRGTFEDSRIGAGTKIDNLCHFGHNIRIGKNCLITAGMMTAGSVTIGDNCVFGGRTTVSGHLEIVSGCHFAGLSGVQKSIEKPGKYGGFPVQPLNDSLKTLASLASLPEIRRQLSSLLRDNQ